MKLLGACEEISDEVREPKRPRRSLCGSRDCLDHVDYRLAETARGKRCDLFDCATGPICMTALILPSESQRVIDHYDDAANAWMFGVYCRRRTLQFHSPQRR